MTNGEKPAKETAAEDGEVSPVSFSTALIFFLVFMLSVWAFNMIGIRWKIDLPSDWYYIWIFAVFVPYVLVAGAVYNRITPPKFGECAFMWSSKSVLALNVIGLVAFPAIHIWNFGWGHWDCFKDPGNWTLRHGEVTGRISGILCGDDLRACVIGVATGPMRGFSVELDALPWYEPHFAVDESGCRKISVRLLIGEAPPTIGSRVAMKRQDCPIFGPAIATVFRPLP